MMRGNYPRNRSDIRKPYRGSRRFDVSCRCHGGCLWCESSRLRYRVLEKLVLSEARRELEGQEL